LERAGNEMRWHHYDGATHGWLQMTAWSEDAVASVKDVAKDMKEFAFGS